MPMPLIFRYSVLLAVLTALSVSAAKAQSTSPGLCQPDAEVSAITEAQRADPAVALLLKTLEKVTQDCNDAADSAIAPIDAHAAEAQKRANELNLAEYDLAIGAIRQTEYFWTVQQDLFSWQQWCLYIVTVIVLGGASLTLALSVIFLTVKNLRKVGGETAVEIAGIIKLSANAAWVTAMGLSIAFLYLFLHEAMSLESENFGNFGASKQETPDTPKSETP